MRFKTILIIIFTVLITIFLMMNTDAVEFNFIFGTGEISKLLVVGICTFVGFVLGYWVGRPKTVISTYDNRFDDNQLEKGRYEDGHLQENPKNTLSDEDRDYIS